MDTIEQQLLLFKMAQVKVKEKEKVREKEMPTQTSSRLSDSCASGLQLRSCCECCTGQMQIVCLRYKCGVWQNKGVPSLRPTISQS